MKKRRKALAFLLALVMLVTAIPMSPVRAEGEDTVAPKITAIEGSVPEQLYVNETFALDVSWEEEGTGVEWIEFAYRKQVESEDDVTFDWTDKQYDAGELIGEGTNTIPSKTSRGIGEYYLDYINISDHAGNYTTYEVNNDGMLVDGDGNETEIYFPYTSYEALGIPTVCELTDVKIVKDDVDMDAMTDGSSFEFELTVENKSDETLSIAPFDAEVRYKVNEGTEDEKYCYYNNREESISIEAGEQGILSIPVTVDLFDDNGEYAFEAITIAFNDGEAISYNLGTDDDGNSVLKADWYGLQVEIPFVGSADYKVVGNVIDNEAPVITAVEGEIPEVIMANECFDYDITVTDDASGISSIRTLYQNQNDEAIWATYYFSADEGKGVTKITKTLESDEPGDTGTYTFQYIQVTDWKDNERYYRMNEAGYLVDDSTGEETAIEWLRPSFEVEALPVELMIEDIDVVVPDDVNLEEMAAADEFTVIIKVKNLTEDKEIIIRPEQTFIEFFGPDPDDPDSGCLEYEYGQGDNLVLEAGKTGQIEIPVQVEKMDANAAYELRGISIRYGDDYNLNYVKEYKEDEGEVLSGYIGTSWVNDIKYDGSADYTVSGNIEDKKAPLITGFIQTPPEIVKSGEEVWIEVGYKEEGFGLASIDIVYMNEDEDREWFQAWYSEDEERPTGEHTVKMGSDRSRNAGTYKLDYIRLSDEVQSRYYKQNEAGYLVEVSDSEESIEDGIVTDILGPGSYTVEPKEPVLIAEDIEVVTPVGVDIADLKGGDSFEVNVQLKNVAESEIRVDASCCELQYYWSDPENENIASEYEYSSEDDMFTMKPGETDTLVIPVEIDEYDKNGQYSLYNIYLDFCVDGDWDGVNYNVCLDEDGNSYLQGDYEGTKMNRFSYDEAADFYVSGNEVDVTAPEIIRVERLTDPVYVGDTVQYKVTFKEEGSGLSELSLDFYDSEDDYLRGMNFYRELEGKEGEQSVVLSGYISEAKEHILSYLSIEDRSGNQAYYWFDDEWSGHDNFGEEMSLDMGKESFTPSYRPYTGLKVSEWKFKEDVTNVLPGTSITGEITVINDGEEDKTINPAKCRVIWGAGFEDEYESIAVTGDDNREIPVPAGKSVTFEVKVAIDKYAKAADFVFESLILNYRYEGYGIVGDVEYYLDEGLIKEYVYVDEEDEVNTYATSEKVYENDFDFTVAEGALEDTEAPLIKDVTVMTESISVPGDVVLKVVTNEDNSHAKIDSLYVQFVNEEMPEKDIHWGEDIPTDIDYHEDGNYYLITLSLEGSMIEGATYIPNYISYEDEAGNYREYISTQVAEDYEDIPETSIVCEEPLFELEIANGCKDKDFEAPIVTEFEFQNSRIVKGDNLNILMDVEKDKVKDMKDLKKIFASFYGYRNDEEYYLESLDAAYLEEEGKYLVEVPLNKLKENGIYNLLWLDAYDDSMRANTRYYENNSRHHYLYSGYMRVDYLNPTEFFLIDMVDVSEEVVQGIVNSVEAPVVGEEIQKNLNPARGENFKAELSWRVGGAEAEDETYAANTEYTAMITLTPEEGYGLNGGLAVGGWNVDYDSEADSYTLTKTFPATVKPEDIRIKSAALKLSDDINVIYRTIVPAGYTDPYMVFTFNGKTYTITDYFVDENGLYCYYFPGVTPQCMGDNISATLYATYGNKQYENTVASYSVLKYCTNQFGKSPTDSFKSLLSNLLVYGEKSQLYMNYKTDQLVTDGLSLTASTFPGLDASFNMQKLTGTLDPNVRWSSAGLVLSNNMAMRFAITTQKPEDYTYEITISDRTSVFTHEDLVLEDEKYYLYYRGIKATEFNKPVTAVIKHNGTPISQVLTYSVNTYIQKNQNLTNSLGDMLKATYNYGKAAEDYAN